MARPTYLYVATGYSHPDAAVRRQRLELAQSITAQLINLRVPVYSPIAHCAPLRPWLPPTLGHDYLSWRNQDEAMLRGASALLLVDSREWADSKGMAAEESYARGLGLPLWWVTPDEIGSVVPRLWRELQPKEGI